MFIVSLPYGVMHGGYWAILAMVGIAHICCHTGKILVECLYEKDDETGELVRVSWAFGVSNLSFRVDPKDRTCMCNLVEKLEYNKVQYA